MPRQRSSYDNYASGRARGGSRGSQQSNQFDYDAQHDNAAHSYSRAAYGDTGQRSASSSYSRRSTHGEYTRIRAKRRRAKTIGIIVACVLALAVVGVGAAFGYTHYLNGKLSAGVDEGVKAELTDTTLSQPFYMLLLGTDKSEERDESGEFGDSYRSDSMILARIDPQQKKVTLVSIERDTLVNIAGYGENKINAAYTLGGAALAVKTVSEFAGVPISHYAEINFDGFKTVVDALGGVDVNVSIEIDDDEAGGYLAAGEQTINGDQALILCRSRHAYDEYGGGDYYRAANQRMVLGAIAKKLLSSDAATMASTVTALCDYITTDMSVTDIAIVANSMRGMDTSSDIYSTMNPTTSVYVGDTWYEYSNDEAWSAMMKRIDAGLSPTPDVNDSANNGGVTDGSIGGDAVANAVLYGKENSVSTASLQANGETVEVQNGSGVTGAAGSAATKLTEYGFSASASGSADNYDYANTLVIYNSGADTTLAQGIATLLGGTAQQNDGSYTLSTDYLVIVGLSYKAS